MQVLPEPQDPEIWIYKQPCQSCRLRTKLATGAEETGQRAFWKKPVGGVYNVKGDFIRDHVRSSKRKSWVIIDEDLPAEYREYGKWSVPFFQNWANSVGPYSKELIDRLLGEGLHPVFGFRYCLGVLGYTKKSKPALEACYGKRQPEADAVTGM